MNENEELNRFNYFGESPWTLEEGIDICRQIEAKISSWGFHCGLTGSCLFRGQSSKDLDIIIYPHKYVGENYSITDVVEVLKQSFCKELEPIDHRHYNDFKTVYWGDFQNKRIDFFFLK